MPIISTVKGIQSRLYDSDSEIFKLIKANVALLIPQPGQGIPVMALKKQVGCSEPNKC